MKIIDAIAYHLKIKRPRLTNRKKEVEETKIRLKSIILKQ